MNNAHLAACLVALLATSTAASTAGADDDAPATRPAVPQAEAFLLSGELLAGQQALEAALAENPRDDQVRFGLGVLQMVRGVERFGQSLHEYGATPAGTRLPIAENPNPAPITYHRFRRLLDDLRRDLVDAEATLAAIEDDDVHLSIRLARVRLDLDGDGEPTDEFLELLEKLLRQRGFPFLKDNPDFLVRFDRGDVPWLRGYCHLTCGVLDTVLAFDGEQAFRQSAERNFANPVLPTEKPEHDDGHGYTVEPLRLARMRRHFVAVCELNRESWKHIRRETDDDHEWLPNPRQKGVLGLPVNDVMIDAWLAMADEVRATFEGERTMPSLFLGKDDKRLNLRRLLDDPPTVWKVRNFPESLPDEYFSETREMNLGIFVRGIQAFGGSAIGYAIWFN